MAHSEPVAELLKRIEDETLDGDVVKALLLCQTLGGHAGSDSLRAWAEKELTGWPPDEYLPDYRMLTGAMIGHGTAPDGPVRMPIPTDMLPQEILDSEVLAIPVYFSISQIQEMSRQDDVATMPSHSGTLANLLNERNQGSAVLGQVHLHCPGSAYGGIVTTVRTKLINLVADLRRSLPDAATIDDEQVSAAVSKAADSLVVVKGDHNAVTVGDKSKAIGDNRRWSIRRQGVPVAVGAGIVTIVGAILELLRSQSIWPF